MFSIEYTNEFKKQAKLMQKRSYDVSLFSLLSYGLNEEEADNIVMLRNFFNEIEKGMKA